MATRKKQPRLTIPSAFRGAKSALGPMSGKLKSAKGAAKKATGKKMPGGRAKKGGLGKALAGAKKMTKRSKPAVGGIPAAGKGGAPPFPGAAVPFE